MRSLLWLVTVLCVAHASAETPPAAATPATTSRAVEKLRAIERDIRSRKGESDAEVEAAREEAKRITKDAEDKSAAIRAEAEAYNRKIQAEIEEIRRRQPGAIPEPSPVGGGPPNRQQLGDALASLVEPLMLCWQPTFPPSARPKPAAVEKCVLDGVRHRLRGFIGK